MKRILIIPLLSLSFNVAAEKASPKAAPAIPHSHASHEGGHVFMSGDDHLEAKMASNGKVALFLSDKFRKPLKVKDFEFEAWTMDKETKQKLQYAEQSKKPFAIHLELASNFSHDQKIFIKFKRLVPPKGHVLGSTPVSFTLMDLH